MEHEVRKIPKSSTHNAEDLKRAEKELKRQASNRPLTHADLAKAGQRMRKGVGKALVEGGKGAAKAVTRAGHELATNKNLHKGVEFGAKAAWEVSKDVGRKTLKDAGTTIGENYLFSLVKQSKRVGKFAKLIDETPSLAAGREAAGIAAELIESLEAYPEMATDLGERLKALRAQIYK